MEQTVSQIASLSLTVAEQHNRLTSAIGEERQAAAALLEKIVDASRPALRALSSRILASERVFWPDSVSTATERSFHDERGVRLAGSGPKRDYPRANDGAVEGTDLYLLADGTFARLEWEGSWTKWQGRASEETSTLTPITALEVVADWPLEDVVDELAERLRHQLAGRAEKTTATAIFRAERLRAVSTILGGRK
jgi:hypothetical protein